jgi:hypothetical protein
MEKFEKETDPREPIHNKCIVILCKSFSEFMACFISVTESFSSLNGSVK